MSRVHRFSEAIRSFDVELPELERATAHRWINETQDGAWTKATAHLQGTLLDRALSFEEVAGATEVYRRWCVDQYRKFKALRTVDEAESFLSSVERRAASQGNN